MNREPQSPLIYYGWIVLAGSALSEMLVIGATSYAAGFFVLPLQGEFHLSRANASSAVLILFLGGIFMAPAAGRILDRYPIRIAFGVGAFCFSLALAVIALTSSLWVMVLALFLPAALGFMMLGPMTTATLASRWFYQRRGLALGLAAVATSGGGFVVVPFLSKAIADYGWRDALLGEAGLFFVVICALAFFVLKDNPYKSGLSEHKENRGRADGALLLNTGQAGTALPWRTILGTRGFWAPSLLIANVSGIAQAIVTAAPPYGHQLGFAAAASALLISAFSLSAGLTKVGIGLVADFWDKRILLFAAAIFMPLSLALLAWGTGYAPLLAACCCAGISLGGVLPTSASVIAARFGAARFGSVMGWSYALIGIVTIAAVRFSGSVFDSTGGYRAAFIGLLGFSVFVWITALILDLRESGT